MIAVSGEFSVRGPLAVTPKTYAARCGDDVRETYHEHIEMDARD
jgi:hypothetical protein